MHKWREKSSMRILISRTDSIGDVVLTLPVTGVLKANFPGCHITFLGRNYTRDIILSCEHVDDFLEFDEHNLPAGILRKYKIDIMIHVFPVRAVAWSALTHGIPMRIGTTNRIYHWYTCNRLVRLSRKKSHLHEAQLNLKLLRPLGIQKEFSLSEIPSYYGLSKTEQTDNKFI